MLCLRGFKGAVFLGLVEMAMGICVAVGDYSGCHLLQFGVAGIAILEVERFGVARLGIARFLAATC